MDCLSLVRFLYEKIWQECLAHVQNCKVGFSFFRAGKRSCVLDLMPHPQPSSLSLPLQSPVRLFFLPVRHQVLTGRWAPGSFYLADPQSTGLSSALLLLGGPVKWNCIFISHLWSFFTLGRILHSTSPCHRWGPYSKGTPQCHFIDSADPDSSPSILSGLPASGQGKAVSLFSTCPGQQQIFWNLGNSLSKIPSLAP